MGGTEALCFPLPVLLLFLWHLIDDLVCQINAPVAHVISGRSQKEGQQKRNEIDERHVVFEM